MASRCQWTRFRGPLPPQTVSVQRPSRWGNPHRVQEVGRDEALRRYAADLHVLSVAARAQWLAPLQGKNLACACALDVPCHADILLLLVTTDPTTHDALLTALVAGDPGVVLASVALTS